MKNYILTILTFFCTQTIFAENRLAIINDQDGFTYVRSDQGKDFNIVDTLFAEDFFEVHYIDKSDWAKISAWRGRLVEGFIHKSKIQEVEKLDIIKQKKLITKILFRQKILADNFQETWKSEDRIAINNSVQQLEFHSDTKYDPILIILPKFFCRTNDIEVLQLFFLTILTDNKSANEMPSFSIGRCFICKPDLVIEQLTQIFDTEQRESIYNLIEWGLLNHFEVEEEEKSDNKEFLKLKALLDNERIKNDE